MGSSYDDYGDGYDYGVDSHYTTGGGGGSSSVHISSGGGGGGSSSSTIHLGGGGGGSSSSSTITIGGGSAGGGSVSVGGGSVSAGGSSTAGGGSASAGTGATGSIATGTDLGVEGEGDYTDLFKEEHITDYGDLDVYDAYGDLDYGDKDIKGLPAETDQYYGQVKNNGRTYWQRHVENEEDSMMRVIKRRGADHVCFCVFGV